MYKIGIFRYRKDHEKKVSIHYLFCVFAYFSDLSFTLLVVVFTLVIDVVESIIRAEAMMINPFIKLSVTAIIYLLSILYYKKRYGG